MGKRLVQRGGLFALQLNFRKPRGVDRLSRLQSVFHRRLQRQAAVKASVYKNIAPRFVLDLRRNRRDFAQKKPP